MRKSGNLCGKLHCCRFGRSHIGLHALIPGKFGQCFRHLFPNSCSNASQGGGEREPFCAVCNVSQHSSSPPWGEREIECFVQCFPALPFIVLQTKLFLVSKIFLCVRFEKPSARLKQTASTQEMQSRTRTTNRNSLTIDSAAGN